MIELLLIGATLSGFLISLGGPSCPANDMSQLASSLGLSAASDDRETDAALKLLHADRVTF